MELGIRDKVAIVTGASRGLGRAIALALAKEGCHVALAARDGAALEATATRIRATGRRALVHQADLRAADAAAKLVAAAQAEFGGIDVVVNNAGATKRGTVFDISDADIQDGFALKFFAAVRITRAAWPALKARRGTIVNIAGMGGHIADGAAIVVGTVNAALLNFTKAMADRGVEDGVRVNAINPGWIETDRMLQRLAVRAKAEGIDDAEVRRRSLAELGVARFGQPEDVAKLVCFLASGAADYVQGSLIDIDGGRSRHL